MFNRFPVPFAWINIEIRLLSADLGILFEIICLDFLVRFFICNVNEPR